MGITASLAFSTGGQGTGPCNLRSQRRPAPATSLHLPSSRAPRCINIYTPGLAGLSPQLLPRLWESSFSPATAAADLVASGQTRAEALVWGLQAPGVEGAVGGRSSDLKKSQGLGEDPASLPRLPAWPPSKSHLIPARGGSPFSENSSPGRALPPSGLEDHSKAAWLVAGRANQEWGLLVSSGGFSS